MKCPSLWTSLDAVCTVEILKHRSPSGWYLYKKRRFGNRDFDMIYVFPFKLYQIITYLKTRPYWIASWMLLVIRQSIHPSTGISKSKNPLSCPTSCAPFFKIYLWKVPVFCFGKPWFFLVLQLSQIASRPLRWDIAMWRNTSCASGWKVKLWRSRSSKTGPKTVEGFWGQQQIGVIFFSVEHVEILKMIEH